jgi:hypothetical protein
VPVHKYPGRKFAVQTFSHPEIGNGSMVPPRALLLDNNVLSLSNICKCTQSRLWLNAIPLCDCLSFGVALLQRDDLSLAQTCADPSGEELACSWLDCILR